MQLEMEKKKKKTLGAVGCIIGFIALVAAFLSPHIAEAIDPPQKPIEESFADFAVKLKDATVAKMKGKEYEPEVEPEERLPSATLIPAIITLGMVGTGFGVGGLLREERTAISSAAITLGITAAVVQWSLLIAGAIIACLLLAVVCGMLGIDPSF